MPNTLKPPELAETAEALAEDRHFDTFKKKAAVGIILITLFAALVEVLHEQDSAQADATALEAQQAATRANDAMASAASQYSTSYENLALAETQQAAASSANQELKNEPPVGWSADQKAAMQERQQALNAEAAVVAKRPNSIDPYGPLGPEGDITFPMGFLDFLSRDATKEEARSELLRSEHVWWVNRAVGYLAILTVLAVSVYLLGLGLTVGEKIVRRIMAYASIFLVLIAGGWTAVNLYSSEPGVDEQALTSYAAGRHLLDVAATHADYLNAYGHLSDAVRRQPNFARAYLDLSIAEFALGAPEGDRSAAYEPTWMYSSDIRWLERSIADTERAYEYGIQSKAVLEDLADNNFLLWSYGGPGDLQRALSWIKAAIELDTHDPLPYFLQGNELLATRDDSAAIRTYREGIKILKAKLSASSNVASNEVVADSAVRVALSELEIIANQRHLDRYLGPTLAGLKESVVAARYPLASNHSPATLDARVTIAQPGSLEFVASGTGLDSTNDNVVVEWYYRHSHGTCAGAARGCGTWINMSANYYANPGICSQYQYFECVSVGADKLIFSAEMLKNGNGSQCLGDGDYRVEVFVNGYLLSRSPTVTISKGWDNITAHRITDMGLAFCGKQDWVSLPNSVPGMLRAFGSPDRSAGYLIARLEHPADATTAIEALGRGDITKVLQQLGAGILPEGLTLDNESDATFDGMEWAYRVDYTYKGGVVRVGAGFAAGPGSGFSTGQKFDRSTLVVAVWGPSDFVATHADELIGSLTPVWRSAFDSGATVSMP